MFEYLSQINQSLFLTINGGLHSPLSDIVIGYATWIGDGIILFPLLVLFVLWYDLSRFWANVGVTACAVVLGGAVLHLCKYLFDTPRPLRVFEQSIASHTVVVNVMFAELHNGSFPSGHTQAAFTAAHLISLMLQEKEVSIWVRIVPYALACLVGLSRVYVGAHFPIDVIGGAIVGIVTSQVVYMIYQRWRVSSGTIELRRTE